MASSLFIVFEGIDGSGKSTLAKLLAESLESLGIAYESTFEPGESAPGGLIRDMLQGKQKKWLSKLRVIEKQEQRPLV